MCKISVLTPIYNVEKYLPQCLDSLLSQTLQDIEFICINDGSTDHSLAILRTYALRDSRIRIINQENGGYGKAMNAGLKVATGKYIGIVESDDFVDPDMFQVLYDVAEREQAEIVKTNYYIYKNGKSTFFEVLAGNKYNQVFCPAKSPKIMYEPMIWNGLQRRDFLLANDIWFHETPGASYQDTSFKFKTFACAKRMYLMKEGFLHYRMDNEASSINSSGKVYCLCDEYAEIDRFLSQRQDLFNPFQYVAQHLKFDGYRWNYHRIASQYQQGFLEHVMQEFAVSDRAGYLLKQFWPQEDWNLLQDMLQYPAVVSYRAEKKRQQREMYRSAFAHRVRTAGHVYIYGAGRVATEVIFALQKIGIVPDMIFVSEGNGNPESMHGIPVYVFSGNEVKRKDGVLLLAVREKDQYEILSKVRRSGVENVILMTRELREALR